MMALLIAAILGPAAANAQTRAETTVPRLASAPVIDGDLSDPCWQEAGRVSGFSTLITSEGLIVTDALAANQTIVRMGYDEQSLYFAFECLEPNPEKIVATGEKRDFGVGKDDHIEIFLQPDLGVLEYDHLGVTAGGVLLDHRVTAKGGVYDYSWSPGWTVKTRILKDRWVAEMAMPLTELLHVGPQMGQEWGLLLGRLRKVEGRVPSCWPNIEGITWHCPPNWARLKGIVIGARENGIHTVSCAAGTTRVGGNKLKIELANQLADKAELKARVKVTAPNLDVADSTVDLGVLEHNATKAFEVPFEIAAAEGRHTIEIRIQDDAGRTLCQAPPVRVDIPAFITSFLDRNYYTREKEVKAYVFLDKLAPAIRRKCSVRGRIVADGKEVWEGHAAEPLGDKVTLVADLGKMPLGKHTFEIVLETEQGSKKLSSLSLELRKLEPLTEGNETKILVRENGTSIILLNGKPFFPLGVFNQSPQFSAETFADAAEAGFTHCVHWKCAIGIEELERQLDLAQEAGIYIVGWAQRLVPRPEKREDRISYASSRDRMRKGLEEWFLPALEPIRQVVHHPALIAWRHFDEAPARHVPNAVLVAERIRELDPYHVQYFSTEGGADLPIAARGGEVFTHDCYTKAGAGLASGYYKTLRLKGQCARQNRVPGVAPQMHTTSMLRYMRYEEQRCHTFLAIIGGAKGLEWFGDRPHILGPWRDLMKIVSQVSKLSPVLVEPDIEQDFNIEQDAAKPVYARLFRKGNDHYLIAINTTIRPTSACFRIKGLKENAEAKEFYQATKIQATADGLALRFGPYEVFVYQLKLDR